MVMRFITCEAGHIHIIGSCPHCYYSQGGLLLGTVVKDYQGRVHTICIDCGMTVDYYIDAKEEKLFKLESVEAKVSRSSSPQNKAQEAEVLKKAQEEEARKKAEIEAAERKAQEAEVLKKAQEEEARKKAEIEEAERKAQEAEKTDTQHRRRISIFG